MSTNCATVVSADTSTQNRVALCFHREALVLVEQLEVRTQSQYQLDYLGDLFVADTIYGVSEYRDTSGVAILVDA